MTNQKTPPLHETGIQNDARSLGNKYAPFLGLLILLALSVAVWLFYLEVSRERERRIFTELINECVLDLTGRLELFGMILKGGGSIFLTSEEITRDDWKDFYEFSRRKSSSSSIQAIGVMPVVRSGELARHIEQVRAEGFPVYTVQPAGKREEYAPVMFVEPFDAVNQRSLGYDGFSEPVRYEAMARARDSGQIALSGKVALVSEQDEASQAGFLLYLPLYSGGLPPESIAERRAAIWGYVYVAFWMHDIINEAIPHVTDEIELLCYDGTDTALSSLVYGDRIAEDASRPPMFYERRTLDLYGRQWILDFKTMSAFESSAFRFTHWIVLGGGVATSLVFFFMIKVLQIRGASAFSLAREMTTALKKGEATFQILNDNLPVGVSLVGPNMEILAVNKTIRQWFPNRSFAQYPPCYEIYNDPPQIAPCPDCPVVRAFQDGQTHVGEREISHAMGRRTLLLRAMPLFGEKGEVVQVHMTMEDITLRKQAEYKLKTSEARLRAITDSAKDAVIMLDFYGNIVFWNPAAESIFGYSTDEASGRNIHALLGTEEYHGAYPNTFSNFHGNAACTVLEYPAIRKDRRKITISISTSSIILEGECYVLGIVRDITESKNKEELLRASEDRFRAAMQHSPVGMALVSMDDCWLEVNDALCQILGYSTDELLQTSLQEITYKEDIVADLVSIFQVLSGKMQSYRIEKRLIHKRGHLIWVLLCASIMKNKDDSPDYFIYQFLDITAQKTAEERLLVFNIELEQQVKKRTTELAIQNKQIEEQRQVLDLVFEQALAGFWDWDIAEDQVLMSPRFKSVLGYEDQEVINTLATLKSLVHPEDLPLIFSQFQRHVESRGRIPYELELRYQHKNGSIVWVSCIGMVIEWMADGRPVRMVGCHVDITAKKRMELDLEEARDAAEAASYEKSRFLANMSHEIRTPMNAIIGFAQMLAYDPTLSQEQMAQILTINRAGEHLLALINNVLDMSKIESGMTLHSPRPFSLHELLDDLTIMFRSRADAKGLQLSFERESDLPFCVLADEVKLRQVFINIIGNAVKFTHEGGVAVRVRAEPSGDSVMTVRLVVEIEDSGPGITATEQKSIFNAFVQGESGSLVGGTGLGLSISRKLVEMMGGSLAVQSEVGRGSCFRFDVLLEPTENLPEKADEESSQQVAGLAPGSGSWRILVVDDAKNNRDLLRYLLQPVGFEVREARNGEEALKVFAEWEPHAVLMNMRMPVLNGYEATRRIKATAKGRDIPVIAVTASAFKGAEGNLRAAGVSAYLRKPFRAAELFEVLGKSLDLSYVYAEKLARVPKRKLTLNALPPLPKELVRAMRESVVKGDIVRLVELIAQVETLDESAATGLKALADRYEYTKLTELLGVGGKDDE